MAELLKPLLQPEQGWRRIEENNDKLIYNGTWVKQELSWHSGGSNISSDIPGDSCTFYIYSTRLRIMFELYTRSDTAAKLYINDELVDTFTTSYGGDTFCAMVIDKVLDKKLNKVQIVKGDLDNYYLRFDCIDIDEDGLLLTEDEYLQINNIRFLLLDNGIYKTYDSENNCLINFTDDVSEIFNDDTQSNFIKDLNSIKDLLTPGMEIVSNKNFNIITKAVESKKQLILASGDFSTKLAANIDWFEFTYSIPENCYIKSVISMDSGLSWYSFINGNWTALNNIATLKSYEELTEQEKQQWNVFLDEVLEKGNNIQDISNLDFNLLNSEKIRFAYAIQIEDANSEVILQKLKWQFDSIGSYEQMSPKTDVNISMTNEAIKIQPLKDVELMKINVSTSSQFSQPQKENEILNKFNINDSNKLTWNNSILITEEDIKSLKVPADNIIVSVNENGISSKKTLQEVIDLLLNSSNVKPPSESAIVTVACGEGHCGEAYCGE